MEEKKKIFKNKYVLIGIIGILVLIIAGISYAFFQVNLLGNKQAEINTGGIKFNYVEGTNNITLNNTEPMSDEAGKARNEYFDFTVGLKTDNNVTVDYIIYLTKSDDTTLSDEALKIYLTDQSNVEKVEPTQISDLDDYYPVSLSKVIYEKSISSDNGVQKADEYRLRVWLDESYKPELIEGTQGDDHYVEVEPKTYKFKVNVTNIENTNPYPNGTVVYFNPVSGEKCDLEAYTINAGASDTENKTGCMKWYTFNDDGGNTINLLLDHNTTATAKWSSTSSNGTNGDAIKSQLEDDVTGWEPIVKATARLISANEIAEITGHPTFDATHNEQSHFFFDTHTNSLVSSGWQYGWLYDRTADDCTSYGCLYNAVGLFTYGYWTSSPHVDYPAYAWFVDRNSGLFYDNVARGDSMGVRPVISVPKTSL